MKKLTYITAAFFLCSITVFAQLNTNEQITTNRDDSDLLPDTHLGKEILPPQVSTGFLNRNPEIKHANWAQDGENYIVTYEREGETMLSKYNYDGTWTGDFSPIEKDDVPDAVSQQLERDYQEHQIEEAFKVETEEGVHYQFVVSDETGENSIRFDAEGNQVEIGESMNNEIMED